MPRVISNAAGELRNGMTQKTDSRGTKCSSEQRREIRSPARVFAPSNMEMQQKSLLILLPFAWTNTFDKGFESGQVVLKRFSPHFSD